MSKSNEEVNKEFDEQFVEDGTWRVLFNGEEPFQIDPHTVKSFIYETRLSDRTAIVEEVREWVENAKFELTPVEKSIKMGATEKEAIIVYSNGFGYNQALSDLEQHLNTLL